MVNYEYYQSLSHEEAEDLFKTYLRIGREDSAEMLAEAEQAGVLADYSIGSIPGVLRWIFSKIETVPCEEDPDVPEWIRNTETYKEDLFDFTTTSKYYIGRMSYYLGECFVRSYPSLSWALGDEDTLLKNMPVVTGFMYEKEMAPINIVEVMFSRMIKRDPEGLSNETAIDTWVSFIKK